MDQLRNSAHAKREESTPHFHRCQLIAENKIIIKLVIMYLLKYIIYDRNDRLIRFK